MERWKREQKPHRWGMTIIRPSDGSPIVGPMMVCACTKDGEHVALTDAEVERVTDGLSVMGFRICTKEESNEHV